MKGTRTADEAIYLGTHYGVPKQHFVDACTLWELNSEPKLPQAILDVGCANGSFLNYCYGRYPKAKLVGIDSVAPLVQATAANVPAACACLADINSSNFHIGGEGFDFIHMAGVHCIFDDPSQAIRNCLSKLVTGGTLILFGSFNRDPIDMLMRYRHSGGQNLGEWQTGWNVFSRNTIEAMVKESGYHTTVTWKDFILATNLEKTSDCMRAWTDKLENGRQIHLNGAMQLLDMQFAVIRLFDI